MLNLALAIVGGLVAFVAARWWMRRHPAPELNLDAWRCPKCGGGNYEYTCYGTALRCGDCGRWDYDYMEQVTEPEAVLILVPETEAS